MHNFMPSPEASNYSFQVKFLSTRFILCVSFERIMLRFLFYFKIQKKFSLQPFTFFCIFFKKP